MNGIVPIVAISILFLGMLLLRALLLVVLSNGRQKNHDDGGPPPRVVSLKTTNDGADPGEPTENHP
jgi:hypothetical protein